LPKVRLAAEGEERYAKWLGTLSQLQRQYSKIFPKKREDVVKRPKRQPNIVIHYSCKACQLDFGTNQDLFEVHNTLRHNEMFNP